MSAKQNVLAMVFDFDQTLIPYSMQRVLFNRYGVNEQKFWEDKEELIKESRAKGVNLEDEFAYMINLILYMEAGKFPPLSNALLRDAGKDLEFYLGHPNYFPQIKGQLENDSVYRDHGITLEFYVISTGFGETIKGSMVGPDLTQVFGAEYLERNGVIHQIARAIGFTKKTQYLHEINKGSNIDPRIGVNDLVSKQDRRIPFENMIYVGDGFTDIPCFATLNDRGGDSMCVYDPSLPKAVEQARHLLQDRRVLCSSPADYRPESLFYQRSWELLKLKADRMVWRMEH